MSNGIEKLFENFGQINEVEILLVDNIQRIKENKVNNLRFEVLMTASTYNLGIADENAKKYENRH